MSTRQRRSTQQPRSEEERLALLQGTLDLLILRTLRLGPAHGHAIVKAIESGSNDVLLVERERHHVYLGHDVDERRAVLRRLPSGTIDWERGKRADLVRGAAAHRSGETRRSGALRSALQDRRSAEKFRDELRQGKGLRFPA